MDGILLGIVSSRPDDSTLSGLIWRVADQNGGCLNTDNEASAGLAPFCMCVAGLVVRVCPLHAMVGRLCKDYVVDAPLAVDFEIGTTQADIDFERDMATEGTDWTDAYLETLAVQRAIANRLPEQHRLLVHGAVIEFEGRAYLFTAPSGTGKSTHIRLWRQYLGDAVRVINGDKPFVRIPEHRDGLPVVYGTPWAGKEGWQCNDSAPLAGIVLLSRSEPGASSIRLASAALNIEKIMRQVYFPPDAGAAALTLDLLDAMLARVPVYELACDMSEDAVRTSFEGLTGLDYHNYVRSASHED